MLELIGHDQELEREKVKDQQYQTSDLESCEIHD